MAEEATRAVAEFVGVEHNQVLLTDRATRAIYLALDFLSRCHGVETALFPKWTYRCVEDMARCVGLDTCLACTPNGQIMSECDADEVAIPTTLGGSAPLQSMLVRYPRLIYDCAHTCYEGMFDGWEFEHAQLAVLSFYPTKPRGCFGGGALIGAPEVISNLRATVYPKVNQPCEFYYPQSVQSYGIMERLEETDPDTAAFKEVYYWFVDRGHEVRFPDFHAPSPHLLGLQCSADLAALLNGTEVEIGYHYPSLDSRRFSETITVPVWTSEWLDRLP